MNEEEKKAINMLEIFISNHKFYNIKHSDGLEDNIEIILELIRKQQVKINAQQCLIETQIYNVEVLEKELNNLKEIEQQHRKENGKLRVELEQEKEMNEKLQNEIMEKELLIGGMKEERRIAIEEIREEYYISKDKIKKFIDEELPEEEICKSCDIYDVNGVSLKEKLEKILEV